MKAQTLTNKQGKSYTVKQVTCSIFGKVCFEVTTSVNGVVVRKQLVYRNK